ncbi:MAG: ribosomal-processing cysteine protease Prp [Firmicutes bacterium]|nr:ribosomal-processing cysteine protease Prp [Bacillota bacterium]
MIEVEVKRNNKSNPVFVEIKGHALFAPYGSDIVCAAVSVLTQTITFALKDLLGLDPLLNKNEGYLSIALPPEMEAEQEKNCYLLLETMLLGLKETARSYPKNMSYKDYEAPERRCKPGS